MTDRYYRNIGLSLDTWRLVDEAGSSRICREVLGKYPTDSQIIEWMLRLGRARSMELEAKADTIQEGLR
jgi:hypothetical protein